MKYSLFFLLQEGQSQLFASVNRNIDASCGYIIWQQDETDKPNLFLLSILEITLN